MTRPVPKALVPRRSCGSCSLCCILPEIEVFDKPANEPCRHCASGGGCTAYADRPATCRDFYCLWRTDESLPDAWEPSRTGMMLYAQGAQLTLLVSPDVGEPWRQDPYRAELSRRAEMLMVRGGYLVIYRGDEVSVFKG